MTDNILLTSGILRVTRVLKKTKAIVFKNLVVGSRIEISVPVYRTGSKFGDTNYATRVTIQNVDTGENTKKTLTETNTCISVFEFEKVQQ